MVHKYEYDVIIAGAGITGASIAWHAIQQGLKVAVIDASGPAAAASGASDGAVSVASKKPGAMARLAGESLMYCKSLARAGGVLEEVFHTRPSFVFASGAQENGALDRLAAMLSDPQLPVVIKSDGPATEASVAGMGQAVSRVVELAGEGHMLGYEAVQAFLTESRADTYWPCSLDRFEAGRDRVWLETSQGKMTAHKLVIATGMGAVNLFPDLPLIARSGQLIVTDHATAYHDADIPGPLTSAAYLLDKSARSHSLLQAPIVIDPLRTGQILIGSSREDGGTEAQTDFRTVRNILSSGVRCLPALANRRVIRVFAGVRAASSDGFPIVGSMPDAENVIVATGFEGDGICLSAIVGREVSKILTGSQPTADFGVFTPFRFQQDKAVVQ